MDTENKQSAKLERAQRKVAKLKGFYNHLAIYMVVNAVLLLFNGKARVILLSKEALGNPDFLNWIDWNVYGTSIVWGIVLMIHAIQVFGNISFFGENWENRKIQEFIKEELENKPEGKN